MSGTVRKSGGKTVRPLGAVRQPMQTFERPGRMNYSNKKMLPEYELLGNAMQVPPPKEEKEEPIKAPVKPLNSVRSGKSDSGSSTKSQKDENMVDKKELDSAKAKIKELKSHISSLEKEIAELKEKLRQRDLTIEEMKAEHEKMEAHYKRLYETEVSDHRNTQTALKKAQQQVIDLQAELAKVIQQQEEKMKAAQAEFDRKLAEMAELKDKEIAERDVKLTRLKQQMAESLKGNSWERQQQLEELTKELGRIQDEADTLRIKLRQYKASKDKSCHNCHELTQKLERSIATIKEKDSSIKDLNSLCSKFESQLKKQDEILKMMADKKGHKLTIK